MEKDGKFIFGLKSGAPLCAVELEREDLGQYEFAEEFGNHCHEANVARALPGAFSQAAGHLFWSRRIGSYALAEKLQRLARDLLASTARL